MKYSYAWLQEYFDRPLPSADDLLRTITTKAFEVEEVEVKNADTVCEVKVLPDRSHDALAHRGMAREIAVLCDIPPKSLAPKKYTQNNTVPVVEVAIEDNRRCPRYIGVRVDNITVSLSPEWLREKLEAIGQRSINNVVDLTNFILFDLGQPMHAFDAAKVAGGITVRLAKKGEKMVTLDNKALTLDGTETVIADDESVLALAGVKGGKKAEVDAKTTSIIFECANFDPTATRTTSTTHHTKTDASKRFENGISSTLAGESIQYALGYVADLFPDAKIGPVTDVYPLPEEAPKAVSVTLEELNGLLGTSMDTADVEAILQRLATVGFASMRTGDAFFVTPPPLRLDMKITEDIIEEIGRHFGYDKIAPTLPKLRGKGKPNKRLYYASKVREFLAERGYSEVFTYSFAVNGEGEVEVLNPVGKDRPFMRKSLAPGIERALRSNFYNAPLLELSDVKIFEIGNVFSERGESTMLALGAMGATKKRWKQLQDEFKRTHEEITELLHTKKSFFEMVSGDQYGVIETSFDALVAELPEPKEHGALRVEQKAVAYRPLSPYPFIVRDVALWVPLETRSEDVERVIRANAGELAEKIYQFDTFEKEGRKSFAFRIVLQSFDRTLEDAEANAVYDRVAAALRAADKNWEVRT